MSNAARSQNGTGAQRWLSLQYLVAIRNYYPCCAMMLSVGWGPCIESQHSASQQVTHICIASEEPQLRGCACIQGDLHRDRYHEGSCHSLSQGQGLPGHGDAQPRSWVSRSCASISVQNTSWWRDGRQACRPIRCHVHVFSVYLSGT